MAASRHPVNAGSRPLWWLPGSAATLLILLLSLGPLAALLWQAGTLSPRTLLADPYLDLNELRQDWVGREDWRYETVFDWQPEPGSPEARLYTDYLVRRDWA